VHQSPSAPDARRDPVVRGANAIDRYSLALQLIQVYPIILAGVAVVLPLKWLRILVAVLGLLIGTAWAIVRERSTESASRRGQDDALVPQTKAEKATAASNATVTVEPVHGIRVDIWLHPGTPASAEPVGRRPRHRQTAYRVHRPALPPKPHHHHQSHADEPEPEDRPGHPASATRAGAGLRRALCSATGRTHGQRRPHRFSELVHEDGPGSRRDHRSSGGRAVRFALPATTDDGESARTRLLYA
jgi:hypothetical protein